MLYITQLGEDKFTVKKDENVNIIKSTNLPQTIEQLTDIILDEEDTTRIIFNDQILDIIKFKRNTLFDFLLLKNINGYITPIKNSLYVPNNHIINIISEFLKLLITIGDDTTLSELIRESSDYRITVPPKTAFFIDHLIDSVFNVNGEVLNISSYYNGTRIYNRIVPIDTNKNIYEVSQELSNLFGMNITYNTFREIINEFKEV